jgi:hypothetical protein
MRALHGHDGKQIDSMAALRDFHGGRKARQPTSNDRDFHSITGHELNDPS